MINKRFTYVQKVDNESTLSANEWNALAQDVVDAVDAINNGETSTGSTGNVTIGGSSDNGSHIYVNNKGNLCIETTANNIPTGKKGKINIESKDDILLKPGDDIMLYSDHRGEGKTDEVSVKVMDGSGDDDVPVKLLLNTSEITLTTKDKTGDNANVMDINVNSGTNTKGYLKVRAQAIDLRCEEHGGIALLPKGTDGQGHENKIKFEHGGGDGLEFATFNTEKTSVYTDEYRFKKDGIWKMATRNKIISTKYDNNDETTHYKYLKQSDDFYDIIDNNDVVTTTKDIINTANFFNNNNFFIDENYILKWSGYMVLIFDVLTAVNYTIIPSTEFITEPGYSNLVFKGLDLYMISNISGPIYINTIEEFKPTIGLSSNDVIPAHSENLFIFAISSGTDDVNVNNTKIVRISPNIIGRINISDIITLVDYFKNGDGRQQGPWATN